MGEWHLPTNHASRLPPPPPPQLQVVADSSLCDTTKHISVVAVTGLRLVVLGNNKIRKWAVIMEVIKYIFNLFLVITLSPGTNWMVLCDCHGNLDKERAKYFLLPVCDHWDIAVPWSATALHMRHKETHQTRPSHSIHWEEVKGHWQGACEHPEEDQGGHSHPTPDHVWTEMRVIISPIYNQLLSLWEKWVTW